MATSIETVFAFGDSNSAGIGASMRRGWLQRLSDLYYDLNRDNRHIRRRSSFYDLSFPGATAESFLDQVQCGELSRRYKGRGGLLSIVAIGAQDISVNFRDARGPQERDLFAKYMATAVGELARWGDILYVGIPSPDMDFMQRVASQRGYAQSVREVILEYEAGTADLVATAAIREGRRYGVVPLFELTESDPYYRLSEDKIHPNDAGHALVRQLVQPIFETMVCSSRVEEAPGSV